MMNINTLLTDATTHATSILQYLHKNAWTIVLIIAGCYFFYTELIDPMIQKYQTARSYKQATDPNRVAVLSPDMKRVRALQQQAAAIRANEAEEERKKKMKSEKERKRVKSPEEDRWDKLGGVGNALGDRDDVVVGGAEVVSAGVGVRRRRGDWQMMIEFILWKKEDDFGCNIGREELLWTKGKSLGVWIYR